MRIKLSHILLLALLCFAGLSMTAQNKHWQQRKAKFEEFPVTETDIVFLGNSITEGGEFAELFRMGNVLNRGIGSDNIPGVRKRLYQVTDGKPAKVFLLIGINDIANGYTVDRLAKEYEALVEEILEKSPDTELYLQAIFPFNNDFQRYKTLYGKEKIRLQANERIADIAERHGLVYINLDEVLGNTDGKLKKEYTKDGLHLTVPGYRAWTDAIRDYVTK